MKKIFLAILLLIMIYSFRNVFDKSFYSFSRLEVDKNFTRQEYLGESLGKIYKNRLGVIFFTKTYPMIYKFESNFFTDLGRPYLFIPLFGFILYLGLKKFDEK